MLRIFRKPEIMVLMAWSITIAVCWLIFYLVGPSGKMTTIRYIALPYLVSLMVTLASIATALALSLKSILLAILLALPGGLFMYLALVAMVFAAKFIDEKPIEISMLFFFFTAICGTLLIRLIKDERKRHKIYQGALLLMVLLTAIAFLLCGLAV